tara:strand:- start:22 stop:396 length:375 start_codon:yes stop_codon:yes gene_type:complete
MKQDYYENKILLKFLKISPNIKIEDDNMNNVLHYIAEDGNLDLANEFLNLADEKGDLDTIINKINSDGKTPLHLAIINGNQELANLFIKKGALTSIVDEKGQKISWIPEQTGGRHSKVYGKRYI